jgi:hypothetical protein
MTHLEFNQQDIENLVNKLGPIAKKLTEQERMLLVAIFAAAGNQAAVSGESVAVLPVPEFRGQGKGAGARRGRQPTVAELKRQLLDGYVPGKDLGTATHQGDKVVGLRDGP